jgi:Tol biopolymer transport system component
MRKFILGIILFLVLVLIITCDLSNNKNIINKIVFTSNRDATIDIYTMEKDGSNVTRITTSPDFHKQFPRLTPDGNKIIYEYWKDTNGDKMNSPEECEIYSINIDGSGITPLTNNNYYDGNPSVSPNGDKIVFISTRDATNDIYTMNIDGSNVTRITTSPDFHKQYPRFTPDGNKIIYEYWKDTNGDKMNSPEECELAINNTDGSGFALITDNTDYDANPSVSVNGDKITFISDRESVNDIYIMNIDGSNVSKLTDSPTINKQFPSFSSDGQTIIFEYWDTDSEIYKINADGTGLTPLTDNSAYDGNPSF